MELLPKQKEALIYLRNNHPANMILYGGAAGGGKTRLGCIWQIQRRLKYPGTKSLIGRAKLDTLKKTTMSSFFETTRLMGLQPNNHYTYNQQSNTITFYNDSMIVLADLAYKPSDPHYQDLGGLELTDAFIDEAAEVHDKAITTVLSRIRYKLNEYNLVPNMLMTCNLRDIYTMNFITHIERVD
jgi:phage terminase large subunit